MVNYRRPARKSIRTRKATTPKRYFTPPRTKRSAYLPFNMKTGTNPQSMLIHRGIGFPDKFRTKLVFCESVVLGPFTPITVSKAYNLAAPYDPDPAVGGGQPTYYDQFALIYNAYNVVGAKMTCKFAVPDNNGVSNNGPFHIGLIGQTSTSLVTTDSPTLATQANCSTDLLSQQQTKTLVCTYKPSFINSDGTNQASTSAVATPYYGLAWASPQGSAATGTVNVLIMVEYIVDFFNLKGVVDV